jgi:hypothetical protein
MLPIFSDVGKKGTMMMGDSDRIRGSSSSSSRPANPFPVTASTMINQATRCISEDLSHNVICLM